MTSFKKQILNIIVKSKHRLRDRYFPIAGIITILAFAASPFSYGVVSAYGQMQSRSITISSSAASATGVTYSVSFIPDVTTAIGGIVVDFCTDPIPGDTCTAPTGLNVGATPTGSAPTGDGVNGGTWTEAAIGSSSPYTTVAWTNSSAQTPTNTTTAITFTITNVTNPSTNNTSFYARFLTFGTAANALAYTPTSSTNWIDAGGDALSTSNTITITAKVQESITFCVYIGSACTGGSVTLGNSNGVLSTGSTYADKNTNFEIATNASHGAVITAQGPILTSGSGATLESSAASGTGSVAATAYAATVGSPQFGFCVGKLTGTTAMTIPATYSDGGNCITGTITSGNNGTYSGSDTFGFNIPNITGATGDQIASVPAGSLDTAQMVFIANISTTTLAGVYTTTLNFVATGTY